METLLKARKGDGLFKLSTFQLVSPAGGGWSLEDMATSVGPLLTEGLRGARIDLAVVDESISAGRGTFSKVITGLEIPTNRATLYSSLRLPRGAH